jgi:thioredoxin
MAVVQCSGCKAKNRVLDGARGTPVCGRCGAELPPAGVGVLVLTDATFLNKIASAGATPVLVDFWANWCQPCLMLAPTLDSLAAEARGRFHIAKLNIEQNPRTAEQYSIRSIPALLIFKNGALVDRMQGVQPKSAIEAALLRQTG